MHNRDVIRKKVVEMLRAGNTTAGTKIFQSRRLPADEDDDLPAILVYTGKETVTTFDNLQDKRDLQIIIQCINESDVAEEMDTALDTLSNQVEYIFQQDPQLGKLVDNIQLSTSEQGVDETDNDIQALVMTFDVTYYTSKEVDTSDYPSFNTANVNYNGRAEDTVSFTQGG